MALRSRAARLAFTALAATLVFALWRGVVGDVATDAIERRLLDLRFAWRGGWTAVEGVAVVAVDEAAAERFGPSAALRSAVADALPRLEAGGARAVAIDLIFAEQTAADALLTRRMAAGKPVALAMAALQTPADPREPAGEMAPELAAALDGSAIPAVVGRGAATPLRRLLLPTPSLAGAGRLGHVNLVRSEDGVVRAMPLALPAPGGRELPALPLAALSIAEDRDIMLFRDAHVAVGDHWMPIDRGDRIVIDHVGGRGAVPTYGLVDVLEGRVPADAFQGRIVFIGATADSLGDIFATPLAKDVAGVEILAGVTAGLLDGRAIRRTDAAVAGSVLLALLLCLGALRASRIPSPPGVVFATTTVWVVGIAVLQVAFSRFGLWLDATAALAGAGCGTLVGAFGRHAWAMGRAARMTRERENLLRYVAPGLAERLARDGSPGFDRRPQDAAVLFVDVNGFTAFAESSSPRAMTDFLAVLHRYFESVSQRHGGVIVDYQGDGAMIVFGLPEAADDDAARALACAADLVDEVAGADSPFRLAAGLRLRAAVHYGPVIAAVLGGRRQAVVTLAGDTVNLASRLMETAKEERSEVITTRETLVAAGVDSQTTQDYAFLWRGRVRGRRAETEIWERVVARAAPVRPEASAS